MEGMGLNKTFWSGKKVFITGHTGFKGSWLTSWLKLLGASITGYSLPPQTNPSLFQVANVAEGITSLNGNILDLENLQKAIQTQQPDIIFHLAAQPLVHYSYQNPIETYAVNVMGTANLLQAVRSIDSTRVVIAVTSDKCYENREWVWGYRESDAMGGFDPYSSSKGCAELVVSAYRRSYFNTKNYDQHRVALATVRAGNVIGGGDWSEDRLIPDLVRSFIKKEVVSIRNPNACRPWQYILDILRGYLMLTEQLWHKGGQLADAWNFGPNDENIKSVSWIADKSVAIWGNDAKWALTENKFPHEATCLKLDCNKSRSILGWEPQMAIHDLLLQTLNWYKAHHHQENMEQFTLQQIKNYENKRA